MTGALSALRYVGGKSGAATGGTGRWIAGLLPYRRAYLEPCAGMLGVLLQRRPSPVEAVNDIDGRVANWWRCVRDRERELASMLDRTPRWSAGLFEDAKEGSGEPGLTGAYYFTLLLHWGFGGKAGDPIVGRAPNFVMRPSTDPASIPLSRLAERMRRVNVENLDAGEFMTRWDDALGADAVWYVDPPYQTPPPGYQGARDYYAHDIDVSRMETALAAMRGPAAVSGYGEEWDSLDWRRLERPTASPLQADGAGARTEVLWMNFPPRESGTLF